MPAPWPEIGSQDLSGIELRVGVVNVSEEDARGYTNAKWILTEDVVQVPPESTETRLRAYTLFAMGRCGLSDNAFQHRSLLEKLQVADRRQRYVTGGGNLSMGAKNEPFVGGKSGAYDAVPFQISLQLQAMLKKCWIPGTKLEESGSAPVHCDLDEKIEERPKAYYDLGVSLYWLRYAQVHRAMQKVLANDDDIPPRMVEHWYRRKADAINAS